MKKGKKPFIIPFFIPHAGCPHKCAFCNQNTITAVSSNLLSPETIRTQVELFLSYTKNKPDESQLAFYGGNFLGLEENRIKLLLNEAEKLIKEKKVDSIRFSTRPDTIDKKRLEIIEAFGVSTIELGIQSLDDQVLSLAKRGHSADDSLKAVKLLKMKGYKIGLQMMVGLPGDDGTKSIETARIISTLSPDFVRIYPTLVLAKTHLAKLYEEGRYIPLKLYECVDIVKQIFQIFSENRIAVIRMGLQSGEDLEKNTNILAGPYHPAFGHLVYSKLFLDMAQSQILLKKEFKDTLSIKVNPQNISKMRGLKNFNIEVLKNKFNFNYINIIPDTSISIYQVAVI